MRTHVSSLAIAVLLTCSTTTRADVLVVDAAGGGDYTSIDDAVFAAADGDTLLIRPILPSGRYPGTVIVGRSLTLVGDPQGAAVRPRVEYVFIEDLTATQRVVLRGLDIQPPNPTFAAASYPAVHVDQCAGAIWIEDCELTGRKASGLGLINCFPTLPGGEGLFVNWSSVALTVVRCELTGGIGAKANPGQPGQDGNGASDGGAAASLSAADAAFFACTLTGGTGGDGFECGETGDGGAGVLTTNASILLAGCTVTGGEPGSQGAGGAGLAGGAFSTFELLETTLAGGTGGPNLDITNGTLTRYGGSARTFAIESPLRESQAGTLSMQGVQGDFVGFFWSFGAGSLPMPARNGWFLLNPAQLGGPFLLGLITDPGGTWDIPITAPLLLPALEAQTLLLQAWFQYPGGVTLGSGTSLTLVDQSF
jgi:hypothetical protein